MRAGRRRTLPIVLAVLSALAGGTGARAGSTEAIISSIHDGQSPYLVVVDDAAGASKRSPGIYASNHDGGWLPLIQGKVVTGGVYQGILAQLSLTDVDRRYQAIVVVDGKIRVLSINTEVGPDPSSVLTLGEGDLQAVDTLGNNVTLPEIRGVDDIQKIWQAPYTEDGQVVVISIKAPPGPLGDGVTLAFVVKKAAGARARLELSGPPIVLDYKFQPYDRLSLLAPYGGQFWMVSRLILVSQARPRKNDTPALRTWRKQLSAALEDLESGRRPSIDSMPVWDLKENNGLKLTEPLEARHHVGNASAIQSHDPVSGHDEVRVLQPNGNIQELTRGRIDFIPGQLEVCGVGSVSAACASLLYVNGEPTLLLENADNNSFIPTRLEGRGELPAALSLFVQETAVREGQKDFHVFVSRRYADRQATDVFLVTRQGGSDRLAGRFQVSETYFNAGEIGARLETAVPAHPGEVLFYDLLEPQGSAAAFGQKKRATAPMLNVTRSIQKDERVQSYAMNLFQEVSSNGALVYTSYDPEGALRQHSGLTIQGEGTHPMAELVGELLSQEGTGKRSVELVGKDFRLEQSVIKTVPAHASLTAYDSTFKSGKASFKLVLTVSSATSRTPENASYFRPGFLETPISLPFNRLIGCQLVLEEKQSAGLRVSAIMSFAEGPGDLASGGVMVLSFSMGLNEARGGAPQSMTLTQTGGFWAEKKAVEPHQISERILMDGEGKAYWVKTPEVDSKDGSFALLPLGTGQTFLPNSAAGRKVKLLSIQESLKMRGEGSEEGGSSSWSGSGYFSMKTRNPWALHSSHMLQKYYASLSGDPFESLEKQYATHEPFIQELGRQVDSPSQRPVHKIVLVSSADYASYRKAVLYALGGKTAGRSRLNLDGNSRLVVSIPSRSSSQADALDSLRSLRESAAEGGRSPKLPFLFATGADILEIGAPEAKPDEAGTRLLQEPVGDGGERQAVLPPLLYLLATEGVDISPEELAKQGKLQDPKIGIVLLSTPEEYERLQTALGWLNQYGILEHFEVDRRFLEGNWKVRAPGTPRATPEITKLAAQPVSDLERQVFPTLGRLSRTLGERKEPARQVFLTVTKEMKPLIKKLLLSSWAAPSGDDQSWSFKNRELDLYVLPTGAVPSQIEVLGNLSAMKNEGNERRTVFVADLDDLNKAARPRSGKEGTGFTISDFVRETGEDPVDVRREWPHFLYLCGAEGKRMQPEEFTKATDPKTISMLMYGTQEELDAMKRDVGDFEGRFGVLKHFEVETLEAPSLETRLQLLERVASSPEIQRIGYRFDAGDLGSQNKGLSSSDAQGKLLSHLVNRSETLARQFSMEVTSCYLKVLAAFRKNLIENPDLRARGVVDKNAIERLLTTIFSIPVNLNILEPKHPWKVLSDERSPLELQKLGYRGPMERQAMLFRTLTAPTRSTRSLAMPSSVILLGPQETGKTTLFVKTMKLLGLEPYQFGSVSNEKAGYIIISAPKLTSDPEAANGDVMYVRDAIQHVHNFLSQPLGQEGHVLIDDLHKGDEKVIEEFVNLLQSWTEVGERGMIQVTKGIPKHRKKGEAAEEAEAPVGETKEIPLRNISVWMTLNQPTDTEKVKRFAPNGTDTEMVVAALSTKNRPLEPSFVSRFALVLNLSKFPMDAKPPALADALRVGAGEVFNVQSTLTLVSPQAVQEVSRRFADTGARTFLGAATSQLLQRPGESGEKGSLFVVVPSSKTRSGAWNERTWSGSGRSNGDIEEFIRGQTTAVAVDGKMDGKLHLLGIMVDALRTHVNESLVDAASQDERFAGGSRQLRNLLAPLLHAVTSNLIEKAYIPFGALNLDPHDFASTPVERGKFRELLSSLGEPAGFFDVRITEEQTAEARIKEFLSPSTSAYKDRRRSQVVREYATRLDDLLKAHLANLMRVTSTGSLPDAAVWLRSLKGADKAEEASVALSGKLLDLYLSFFSELMNPSLMEVRFADRFPQLSMFDVGRLFMTLVDRSVTRLPWGQVTRFMVDSLMLTAGDHTIGQNPGVLHYLFASKVSLLRPATHEMVLQMATSSQAFRELGESKEATESEWRSKCMRLFEPVGGAAK